MGMVLVGVFQTGSEVGIAVYSYSGESSWNQKFSEEKSCKKDWSFEYQSKNRVLVMGE